ncbi:hypothetical protein [Azohydromonas lata]|uniref:Peptide chain release factor 2 n=1 Tax=Azohydromonas lata TaxID=45677 RepID=A0ABU5IH80_9BURK|nr:hypothetical protein [Azohydromonas lata]MDZ5457293.1 hypothetical protein [Azohydromonas lata]
MDGGRRAAFSYNARTLLNGAVRVRKSTPFTHHNRGSPHMDIERINAIGSLLTDLSERTSALRGYL